jgi:hypothetical protein
VLIALGALVAALALAPHGAIAALIALAVARVAHLARRHVEVRSVRPARRLQYTCAAGALASALLAVALGAAPLLAGVAACGAVVAFLSGLPAIGGAVLAAGALALAGGGEPALAAGLIAAGIAAR